jgi:2-C-methyl-D-erythritol 4-phosphate cytidylyltransferase
MHAPASGEGAPAPSGTVRKQYLAIGGVPVLLRALRPFLDLAGVRSVVVALPAEDAAAPPPWLEDVDPRVRLVSGGATRQASVRAGLDALPADVDIIIVHDGARPLVTKAVIARCVAAAAEGVGAVAGWPVVDTIKQVEGRRVTATPDRSTLWHAQTPQAFPRDMLLNAYRGAAGEDERNAQTDDAGLVARQGGRVVMVEGSPRNIKVTRPDDVRIAEALLAAGDGSGT